MNIHEYQAKQVLKGFGAPVSDGAPVLSAEDIDKAVDSLPGPVWVVKSQIHAGGRGKGRFKELGSDAKGGVRVSFSADEAKANAREMFGNTLVTKQTGEAGKQVNRLYIEDGADIDRELYCSILVNRETGKVSFVASTEEGMDIEAVAEDTPDKILHYFGTDCAERALLRAEQKLSLDPRAKTMLQTKRDWLEERVHTRQLRAERTSLNRLVDTLYTRRGYLLQEL